MRVLRDVEILGAAGWIGVEGAVHAFLQTCHRVVGRTVHIAVPPVIPRHLDVLEARPRIRLCSKRKVGLKTPIGVAISPSCDWGTIPFARCARVSRIRLAASRSHRAAHVHLGCRAARSPTPETWVAFPTFAWNQGDSAALTGADANAIAAALRAAPMETRTRRIDSSSVGFAHEVKSSFSHGLT